jgi:hypothetical protein
MPAPGGVDDRKITLLDGALRELGKQHPICSPPLRVSSAFRIGSAQCYAFGFT